jgi:NADH-quinone oxidoreductase subunit J
MIAFWILAIIMIASAVFTVTAQKPVHSVIGLLVNFIALAILYLSLQAEFLAVMQIVVYSGAILILFVFVIALLSSGVRAFDIGPDKMSKATLPIAIVIALATLGGIVSTALRTPVQVRPVQGATGDPDVFGSVANFGSTLFYQNLLPFEVTAFILMVAVIGVVLIAGDEDGPLGPRRRGRKRRSGEREPIVKREPITR